MIIKLCKMGVTRHIECVDVMQQFTANGDIDLDITTPKGQSIRLLLGTPDGDHLWTRAYIMENGRTVDTIQTQVPACGPAIGSASGTFDGKPIKVRVAR